MSDEAASIYTISDSDDEQPVAPRTSGNGGSAFITSAASSAVAPTTHASTQQQRHAAPPSFAAFSTGASSSSRAQHLSASAAATAAKKAPASKLRLPAAAPSSSVARQVVPTHAAHTSHAIASTAPATASASSAVGNRLSDIGQAHLGPSTRRNQQPQTYEEMLHAARGRAAPVKPTQGAPKAVWDEYEEKLAEFRQDEEAIRLQAETQQEEAKKKEAKALQQIDCERVHGLHIRDLFWPDYEKLDKIAQYSAFLGEGPTMALRAQAARAGTLSSILPSERRLDECIRYWDAHASSYLDCIEFSVELRRPSGMDPNSNPVAEYSWSIIVCNGHVPHSFGRGANEWAEYVIVKPPKETEAEDAQRLFTEPATAISKPHVTVTTGTDNPYASLPLHTPLMPEKYAPVGRGAPPSASTSSASASASASVSTASAMNPTGFLNMPSQGAGRGRGAKMGGIKAYMGAGGGRAGQAAPPAPPPRLPLQIDLFEGDLIIGIDDIDLRDVSGVDVVPGKQAQASQTDAVSLAGASMLSSGTGSSEGSRLRMKNRAYDLCVAHLKSRQRVLLRVRRLTAEGRQNFYTAIMPSRPTWLHAVDESLLRQGIVRLLRGELIALKSYRTHGQQYMAHVAKRIETAISHYQSAAVRERDEALQTARKYSYPSAWRAIRYSPALAPAPAPPPGGTAASNPFSSASSSSAAPAYSAAAMGAGLGSKRRRSVSSLQDAWGGDEGWEDSGFGSSMGTGTGTDAGTGTGAGTGAKSRRLEEQGASASASAAAQGGNGNSNDDEDDPFADAFGDAWCEDDGGGEGSVGGGGGSGSGSAGAVEKAWACGCTASKAMSLLDAEGRPLNPHSSPSTADALVHFILHEADLLLHGVQDMPEYRGTGSAVPVPVLLRRGYVPPAIEEEELQLLEEGGANEPASNTRADMPGTSTDTGTGTGAPVTPAASPIPSPSGEQVVHPATFQSSVESDSLQEHAGEGQGVGGMLELLSDSQEKDKEDQGGEGTGPLPALSGASADNSYQLNSSSSAPALYEEEAPALANTTATSATVLDDSRDGEGGGGQGGRMEDAMVSSGLGAGASAASSAHGGATGRRPSTASAAPVAQQPVPSHAQQSQQSQQVCDTCQIIDGRDASCDGALPSCNNCSDDNAQCTYAGVPGEDLVGKTRNSRAKGSRSTRGGGGGGAGVASRAAAPAAAAAHDAGGLGLDDLYAEF